MLTYMFKWLYIYEEAWIDYDGVWIYDFVPMQKIGVVTLDSLYEARWWLWVHLYRQTPDPWSISCFVWFIGFRGFGKPGLLVRTSH